MKYLRNIEDYYYSLAILVITLIIILDAAWKIQS